MSGRGQEGVLTGPTTRGRRCCYCYCAYCLDAAAAMEADASAEMGRMGGEGVERRRHKQKSHAARGRRCIARRRDGLHVGLRARTRYQHHSRPGNTFHRTIASHTMAGAALVE